MALVSNVLLLCSLFCALTNANDVILRPPLIKKSGPVGVLYFAQGNSNTLRFYQCYYLNFA